MHIGYARVSTAEQNLDLQLEALKTAGCEKFYQDQLSGTRYKLVKIGLYRKTNLFLK